MTRTYRVILPISLNGRIFSYGQTVELEFDQALLYAHALIATETEQGEQDHGRHTERHPAD